ncbi:MAG: dependent ligase [Candidatus Acidoferrum typicum]|nr:dependent ligase [Candidatus Acidoferrum typicum]
MPHRKPEFIEPMECALVSNLPEGPQWTYEAKLDGYRAIGVRDRETILYSRNHKNFNKRFPQIAEALTVPERCPFSNDMLLSKPIEALRNYSRVVRSQSH